LTSLRWTYILDIAYGKDEVAQGDRRSGESPRKTALHDDGIIESGRWFMMM